MIAPAAVRPSTPRRTCTVVFTDMVGSTEQLSALGEDTWLALLEDHAARVHDSVIRNGGSVLKFLGDGWMVVFTDPRHAVAFAVELQRAAAGSQADVPLRLRIGIHAGTAREIAGDLVGRDVILASRIMRAAGAGEILVSSTVRRAMDPAESRLDAARELDFRDLGAEHVSAVRWLPYPSQASRRTRSNACLASKRASSAGESWTSGSGSA